MTAYELVPLRHQVIMTYLLTIVKIETFLSIYVFEFKSQHPMAYHRKQITLQWCHNECNGVPHHQPHDCLLNRLFRRISKKTSTFCVTHLCAAISPFTGEFPAQMASYAENVSIWWRHHDMKCKLIFTAIKTVRKVFNDHSISFSFMKSNYHLK